MIETEIAHPPFPRKSDLEALRERNNAWKYITILTLRDEKNLSWDKISDRTHYSAAEVRRIYFRAKKFSVENPKLLSERSFANAPMMTKDKAKYLETCAINILSRAVLDMRDRQGLMYKEIAELTGFSISRLISIYEKASSMKREAGDRLSKISQPTENTNLKNEITSISEIIPICTPLMQKSDAWLLKAGINAQKYKTVLELRDGQKLSWRRIGDQMHYSQNQVQRYYARAKKLLALSADNPDIQLPESGVTHPIIKQEDVKFSKARIRNELYRTVLKLRDGHGLIFKDIAERTGFSQTRVKALYREASRLKRIAAERASGITQST